LDEKVSKECHYEERPNQAWERKMTMRARVTATKRKTRRMGVEKKLSVVVV
jgi:hypothetical protein